MCIRGMLVTRQPGKKGTAFGNVAAAAAAKLLLLLLSHISHVQLCATPETAVHQAPLSLGFSWQEHWSRVPFPSPMQESEK